MEETLMLGKTEGRRREWQRMRLDGITDSVDMNLLRKTVKDRGACHAAVLEVTKSQTQHTD